MTVKTHKENEGMVPLVLNVGNRWRKMSAYVVIYVAGLNCETGGIIKVFFFNIFT